MRLWIPGLLVLSLVASMFAGTEPEPTESGARAAMLMRSDLGPSHRDLGAEGWLKGNTHTHTLWSDGNAAPEWVAKWYVDHGYDFLVLSDHNVLSVLKKFFPIAEGSRLTRQKVDQIAEVFGEGWVEERTYQERQEMRLKTLDELRAHFEQDGSFLFVQGEEITDSFGKLPVHINAMNIEAKITPQKGGTVVEVMQRNLQQVLQHAEATGKPMLAHLNHPNFGWGVSADDIAVVAEEKFFEVYNGHPGVRNYGDKDHLGTEAMWDHVLTRRLRDLGLGLVYGVATDDAHEYFNDSKSKANTGAGWVMVACAELDSDALVEAMHRGDFYASSGVSLKSIRHDAQAFEILIEAQEGVEYRTEFRGTRDIEDAETGELLAAVDGSVARYEFGGDELYVRATVRSTRLHPRPFAEGDLECAWVQPVVLDPGERR